ncbi:hypothetical protein GCM10028786_15550 [Flaviaesturariibacter terrae]
MSLFFATAAGAQLPTYRLEAGESLADVISAADFYRYPAFREGRVQFRDGYVKTARLNLSYLLGQLEFIGPKGDTLVLEGVDDLAHVAIGQDTFFFYAGAVQQVDAWKGRGRLLQYQQLKEESSSSIGGYDANDPSGSVEATTRYNANNSVRSLAVRRRTTYVRDSKLYFWKDNTAEPMLLERRSLEKIYPGRKAEIAEYLRAHKVDFRLADQVRGLIAYLQALP